MRLKVKYVEMITRRHLKINLGVIVGLRSPKMDRTSKLINEMHNKTIHPSISEILIMR
jgi:hypothetical protein